MLLPWRLLLGVYEQPRGAAAAGLAIEAVGNKILRELSLPSKQGFTAPRCVLPTISSQQAVLGLNSCARHSDGHGSELAKVADSRAHSGASHAPKAVRGYTARRSADCLGARGD